MDASETTVDQLLKHMGFSKVIFEPDGNIPPDFLVDDHIAVEVRRLNQNHDDGDGIRGLEETSIPLWKKIEKLAYSYGPPDGQSWFLFFRFSRPVRRWKELERSLRHAIEEFIAQPHRQAGTIYVETNFELEVFPASNQLEYYFCMGGSSDHQSGGFVVAEMLKNIAHCSLEKLKKIEPYRGKYQTWWLVLTDHIGFGLDDFDNQQLLAYACRLDGWDKILIVSPSNSKRWIEF